MKNRKNRKNSVIANAHFRTTSMKSLCNRLTNIPPTNPPIMMEMPSHRSGQYPFIIYPIKEPILLKHVPIREIGTATYMGKAPKVVIAGTSKKPPPIPNDLDTIPITRPRIPKSNGLIENSSPQNLNL